MGISTETVNHLPKSGSKPLHSTKWGVGDLIRDRYEVYDIKKGGIGTVYIVYDYEDRIPYAVKTLQDRHLLKPALVERFIREAEVWVRLGRHQNIVRAICVDQIDNSPYILLECIVGSSLREALSKGPLPVRTVLGYAIQFCRGMIHAQEEIPGFTHLDIKPENCLITQDYILKVTDFSLSKAVFGWPLAFDNNQSGEPPAHKKGRRVAGTFPYMSPERFLRVERVGVQADIYSFGIMLFEMLTGRRPFAAGTARQWREAHLKERPRGPRVLVGSIPEAMLRGEFRGEVPTATSEELESWEYSNRGVSLCNLEHVEEAISCFEKALAKNSRNPHAWLNKGVAFGTLGDTQREIECYEEALAIVPDYGEAWYNKGLALYGLGRFKEALACYDRALAINPHQAETWVNKGSTLGCLGQPEEEYACYEKALAIKPDHPKAWVGKASALISLGQFEKANACCDKALDISPEIAEAWVNKASALGALSRFKEAVRCCEKALAINPRLCEAWVCKGLALGSLDQFEQEVSCYQEALALNPDHVEALYRKGLVLMNLGRFEQALACYDQALTYAPKNDDLWVKRGLTLARMDRFEEALSSYDTALGINPQHARAWYQKGLALRDLGSTVRGDRCIQKGVGLDPALSS
jgi:tetratricopeptide (TPR) repeat protein